MPAMIHYTCLPFSELTLKQLYDAMALRQSVFVVEQNCPYLDADGKDPASWHVLGYETKTDRLVAYTRLAPVGVFYADYSSIGRVVTAPSIRGRGVGRQLMEESLRQVGRLFGEQPVKISAQSYLLNFYRELGFEPVGEEYLEDGIPHIGMIHNPQRRPSGANPYLY